MSVRNPRVTVRGHSILGVVRPRYNCMHWPSQNLNPGQDTRALALSLMSSVPHFKKGSIDRAVTDQVSKRKVGQHCTTEPDPTRYRFRTQISRPNAARATALYIHIRDRRACARAHILCLARPALRRDRLAPACPPHAAAPALLPPPPKQQQQPEEEPAAPLRRPRPPPSRGSSPPPRARTSSPG
jgi:hypothetical protein